MATKHPKEAMAADMSDVEVQEIGPIEAKPLRPDLKVPDGGWGWVIVACSLYISGIYIGLVLSFGILFSDELIGMGVSSTNVAWILNFHCFLWHLTSTLTGPLTDYFGWRTVAFTGSLVSSLGFVLMSFSTTPIHIFLLFSVLIGLAGGASANVCFLVVVAYFDKRRGTATAVIMAGVSAGQIYVPLLLRALQDEYGFFGATLIFGALISNCCVASLTFHPLKRHLKKTKLSVVQSGRASLNELADKSAELLLEKSSFQNHSNNCSNETSAPAIRHSSKNLINILKSTFKNVKEIRRLNVVVITFGFSCLLVGYVNFIAQLPFAMQVIGHTPQEASWCVSVSAIGNTVARILVSCFSDKKWFNRKICYLSGSIIAGIFTLGTVLLLDRVKWIMACMVVWGIGVGANLSVYHALLIDICGFHLFVPCLTATGLLLAVISVAAGPCIGAISDASSYSWSMAACAGMQFCSALLWSFMPSERDTHGEEQGSMGENKNCMGDLKGAIGVELKIRGGTREVDKVVLEERQEDIDEIKVVLGKFSDAMDEMQELTGDQEEGAMLNANTHYGVASKV